MCYTPESDLGKETAIEGKRRKVPVLGSDGKKLMENYSRFGKVATESSLR